MDVDSPVQPTVSLDGSLFPADSPMHGEVFKVELPLPEVLEVETMRRHSNESIPSTTARPSVLPDEPRIQTDYVRIHESPQSRPTRRRLEYHLSTSARVMTCSPDDTADYDA